MHLKQLSMGSWIGVCHKDLREGALRDGRMLS
jgi:hypothetical protein